MSDSEGDVMDCCKCGEALPDDGHYLRCSICKNGHHLKCTNMKETTYVRRTKQQRADWKCEKCRNDNAHNNSQNNNHHDDLAAINKKLDKLLLLNDTVGEMRKELSGSIASQKFISKQYDDMTKHVKSLVDKINTLNDKVSALTIACSEKDSIIEQQEERIQELEQRSRINNFMIHGVVQTEREDVEDITIKVSHKLGVKITKEDIEASHRVPTRKPGAPKPIVVHLKSRKQRDHLIAQRKSAKISNHDVVGKNVQAGEIFITEQLSPRLNHLKWEAWKKAQSVDWRFVWPKGGKLWARKNETTAPVKILTMSDIDKYIK